MILPDRQWWQSTTPGQWWSAQPVAHAFGGIAWTLFAIVLWWPHGSWRALLFAGGMTAYWQLRLAECEPDSQLILWWALYDTLTAVLASAAVLGVRVLVG